MNKLTVPKHFVAILNVTITQIVLAFGLYFLLSSTAQAQVSLSTSYTMFTQAEKTEGKLLDLNQFTADLGYKFQEVHRVRIYTEGESYNDPKRKSQLTDLHAQYGFRAWQDKRKWNSLNFSVRAGAPVNDNNKEQTLQGYVRANVSTNSTLATISPDLSLTLRANFRKNFNEKETITVKNEEGKDELRSTWATSSGQGFDLNYNLAKNFSLGLTFTHINLWRYSGDSIEIYTHGQSATYKVSDQFGVTLAHTMAPDTIGVMNEDGSDYAIKGFDGQNSYFSIGASFSI